jgi:hypothetical protein
MEPLKTSDSKHEAEAVEVRRAFERIEADLGADSPQVQEFKQEVHEAATDDAALDKLYAKVEGK